MMGLRRMLDRIMVMAEMLCLGLGLVWGALVYGGIGKIWREN